MYTIHFRRAKRNNNMTNMTNILTCGGSFNKKKEKTRSLSEAI